MNAFSASERLAIGESGVHGRRASMHDVASRREIALPPLLVSESLSVTSTRWMSGAASPAASEAIAAGSPARRSGLRSLSVISE